MTANTTTAKLLYWAPRVLGILFVVFISLFALDIFGQGYTLWETVVGLFMHLIPSFILIAALVLAWRWELVGAAFVALGLAYIGMTLDHPGWWLPIAGPALLLGGLFVADWFYRRRHSAG